MKKQWRLKSFFYPTDNCLHTCRFSLSHSLHILKFINLNITRNSTRATLPATTMTTTLNMRWPHLYSYNAREWSRFLCILQKSKIESKTKNLCTNSKEKYIFIQNWVIKHLWTCLEWEGAGAVKSVSMDSFLKELQVVNKATWLS